MKETELYEPVKKLLADEGYEIRGEVAGADIAAVKGDELLLVEMKTSLNMRLLLQAVKRQRLTDKVFIAVPRPQYKKRFSRDIKDREYLLRRLSLGLIYVVTEVEVPYASIVFEPLPFNMKLSMAKTKKKKVKLLNEYKGRSGDFNIGGSVKTKLVTAYRENSLKIAYYLNKNEQMKTKELREAGCPETSTSILYDNHYGWFEKTGRAEYKLSDSGKEALVKYSQIVKHIIKENDENEN